MRNSEWIREDAVTISAPVLHVLSDFLHAMGQPLTTLQIFRLATAVPSTEMNEIKTLLPEMAEQVDRMTDLYRGIRGLFEAEAAASQVDELSLSVLLERLEPEWRRQAFQHHVQIRFELEGRATMPCLRMSRGLKALSDLFDVILPSVLVNGILLVTWVSDQNARTLRMTGGHASDWYIGSAKLNRQVSAALLKAEGCDLICEDWPMRFSLKLP